MFQYDPKLRITLADILGSEWMLGDTATHEEVISDFNNRKEKVAELRAYYLKEEKEKDKKKKAAEAKKATGAQKPVYRNVKLISAEPGVKEESKENERQLDLYEKFTEKNTVFFSLLTT